MRKIHSFESFNRIYEADSSLGVTPTDESKLYDQTLGLILTTILNSYGSLLYFPVKSYSQNIDADLASVKSSPLEAKVEAFSKIMAAVKLAASDNKIEGSQEAIDAWVQAGTKAAEALNAIINKYKDQSDEKDHINKFVNVSLDNFMNGISDASKENELRKDVASVKESYEYVFEGFLQGKKGMIEDVSKKITLVMAKLGSLANTPGMASEVQKLQSEVAGIAAQMGELLNKKNKEINKEDIKKADARLTEIPTVLDKLAERMLKQDSINKEAASILVQAFNLVQAAKDKEKVYISKKEEADKEADAKSTVSYDVEKIKDVNPIVKKFQELVISKLGKNKQISSLASFKKMGTDGKYGPATKQMVQIVKSGFDLKDTSGEKITSEVIKELEKQSALTESRIYSFGQFSDYLLEDFNIEKATMVAKSFTPSPVRSGQSRKSSSAEPKFLFKKGSTGNVVIAINRIVGQTEDERNYTDETVQRVKDFQKLNNLYVDGIAGEDTINKLYSTRLGAEPQSKLNDPKAPRGQWAYKTLADLLKETYVPSTPKTSDVVFTDDDLLGEADALSSFINTILPAAKYAAFINPALWIPAAFMTAADLFKDRRTGVKGVVDALDGYVKESDLAYVYTVLKALVGKKMKDGKPAIQRFKELYKADENGDDLASDVNSVGTKTFSTKGTLIKEEILKLLGQK